VDLVLYDGVCGLCDRLNRFVLARDRADRFRFAALQGELARRLLSRHGREAGDLDTFYVVARFGGPDEAVLDRGRAAVHVLGSLGVPWSAARALRILPRHVLDALYDFVAWRRYRWFGRFEACRLPDPRYLAKFLDAPDS
jgi:predicted DCC family thiol-disulfide oxidoreductase YuxK